MARVLFLDAIDEVLEVIAVPLAAETLHDIDPVTVLAFPVLGQLIIAPLPLTEQMCADKVQLFIVDADLSGRDLIFQGAVRVFPRYRIPA